MPKILFHDIDRIRFDIAFIFSRAIFISALANRTNNVALIQAFVTQAGLDLPERRAHAGADRQSHPEIAVVQLTRIFAKDIGKEILSDSYGLQRKYQPGKKKPTTLSAATLLINC